jgi:hypothetical protein
MPSGGLVDHCLQLARLLGEPAQVRRAAQRHGQCRGERGEQRELGRPERTAALAGAQQQEAQRSAVRLERGDDGLQPAVRQRPGQDPRLTGGAARQQRAVLLRREPLAAAAAPLVDGGQPAVVPRRDRRLDERDGDLRAEDLAALREERREHLVRVDPAGEHVRQGEQAGRALALLGGLRRGAEGEQQRDRRDEREGSSEGRATGDDGAAGEGDGRGGGDEREPGAVDEDLLGLALPDQAQHEREQQQVDRAERQQSHHHRPTVREDSPSPGDDSRWTVSTRTAVAAPKLPRLNNDLTGSRRSRKR